jgi:replicative DNA helicase
MTAPTSPSVGHERLLGPAFDAMTPGLVLVGAPSAVGKTCLSLNLAVHFAAHLDELVLYYSPGAPKEVILTRLAKNITPEGEKVDVALVAEMPCIILDSADPSSHDMIESATAFVEQHGQPGLVLVNDLQNIRPAKEGLSGVAAAIEILADMRAISKICDAPVVLFSQITAGKSVAASVAEQADRVVTVNLKEESGTHKRLEVGYFDPPEPEADRYELSLTRQTGVIGLLS